MSETNQDKSMDSVLKFIDDHRERFIAELQQWVRIPSISALAEHTPDVERSAEHLAHELRALGATDVQVWPTARHPAVFASFMHAKDKPTLLIYGHHDVQPVEPLGDWRSPPFEAVQHEGRLYGRGTVDDKGQVYIHVKAIEAFLRTTRGKLPINLKLLVEGEEEIGSPHLGDLLRTHAKTLSADYVCVSDTAMYGRGMPSLCVGLRGVISFELQVHGPETDVHSGTFGGGIANPANALARIITSFHDEKGRILVPGFYDDVVPPSDQERETITRLPHDDNEWLKASGAKSCFGEEGYSTLERIWTRPTLDINGMASGHFTEGEKNIIPRTAIAKLSCRLVPNQTPETIHAHLTKHVQRNTPPGITVEISPPEKGALPYVADTTHPIFNTARRAFQKAFGKETILMREGGTIPFVHTITEIIGKPTLMMGFGQPDENSHAPNEWLGLDNFHVGIKSAAWLYEELGKEE